MPPPGQPSVKSPLRFCLSCGVTLGCWALWLVLGTLLVAQLYVLFAKEMTLPGFMLRRLERELAAQNLAVRFGSAHFDPTGRVVLSDVALHSLAFEEPLLTSRLVFLRKSPWSILAGRLVPDEVRLEGASLQLPAMLSPSGAPLPLFRDLAATLRFEHQSAHVDQFAFRLENVAVSVHGTALAPARTGRTWTIEELTKRFIQLGRHLANELPRLRALQEPVLDLALTPRPTGGFEAVWQLTAAGLQNPEGLPLRLGPLVAGGRWLSDLDQPAPLDVTFRTESAELSDRAAFAPLTGHVRLHPSGSLLTPRVIEGQLAAGPGQAWSETLPGIVLRGDYAPASARARLSAAARLENEAFDLSADLGLRDRSARLKIEGLVRPALVDRNLDRYAPKLAPYFRFGDPVEVHAEAALGPDWHFTGLRSRVRGGRLDSRGVPVTSTRGRIDVDADLNFLAHDALVTLGENHARGSYAMNFRTMDYRMLLVGGLRPPAIAGWFRGDWWLEFWKNFTFSELPLADVDVTGNWRDPARTLYFGGTTARGTVVQGADFEAVAVRVFVRPALAHVLVDEATRAGGTQRAEGWFRRTADPDSHQLVRMDYDLRGTLDPAISVKLGGDTAAQIVAPWRFGAPPTVAFSGHTDFSGPVPAPHLAFQGTVAAPATFYGFPLERATVRGRADGDLIQLDQVEFGLAGGQGSGKASLTGRGNARQLGFDLYLKDADLGRTIRAVEQYEAARTGQPFSTNNGSQSKFMKRASGGHLEIALSAQGNPDSFESFRGGGNLRLTGAELAEVHLFGLLSQVLSAVSLNFSSLKLDTAGSSFQLAEGKLHFPDVKLTGPNSATDAVGDFRFADKSLDFTAKFRPYETNRNLITGVLGLVVNPLSSFFELKLSGSVSNPKWSVVLAPGALRAPGTPAPTGSPLAPATLPPPPDRSGPTPSQSSPQG